MKHILFLFSTIIFLSLVTFSQDSEKTFKQELDEFRENMQKQMPKEAWEQGERIGNEMTDAVIARGGMEKVLKVGKKIPAFTMNDAFGKPVASKDLLKKGATVFVFYRGAWCPFCNLYLRAIQKKLPEINKLGANLVAVTSAVPDMKFEKEKLNFTVLSDPQNQVSKQFGLVYEVTQEMNTYYKNFGKDLVKDYGTEKPELLMSAVYIVDKKGVVRYMKAEAAYKNWAEPKEILEFLAKMK
jgi:peroxiredoxin